jgi:hypothetical protein
MCEIVTAQPQWNLAKLADQTRHPDMHHAKRRCGILLEGFGTARSKYPGSTAGWTLIWRYSSLRSVRHDIQALSRVWRGGSSQAQTSIELPHRSLHLGRRNHRRSGSRDLVRRQFLVGSVAYKRASSTLTILNATSRTPRSNSGTRGKQYAGSWDGISPMGPLPRIGFSEDGMVGITVSHPLLHLAAAQEVPGVRGVRIPQAHPCIGPSREGTTVALAPREIESLAHPPHTLYRLIY